MAHALRSLPQATRDGLPITECPEFAFNPELQTETLTVTLTRQEWRSLIALMAAHRSTNPLRQSSTAIEADIEMVPIFNSSTIDAIGYHALSQTLQVDFQAGSRYHYHDVPEDLFEALLNPDSKGRFLNSEIKGHYDYEPVEL
jgi:hypothetical protein